jgi:hypothetical protein
LGHQRILELSAILCSICLVFNALYFLRLIPPVPLSLKAIGVYHSLERNGAGYYGAFERASWWQFWSRTSHTYHTQVGEPATCFSSIFAPTGLMTPIVHHWFRWDAAAHGWVSVARITFPITGGRTGGYYGYSVVALSSLGRWRCDVETISGALIGRSVFNAVPGTASTTLERL